MEKQVITLISDWGWDDVSLGLLKWELARQLPAACMVDLTHEVELLDVGQTAFILSRLYQRFPAGSVHLILTGVSRWMKEDWVVVKVEDHYFVGIDNGTVPSMFADDKMEVRRFASDVPDRLQQLALLAKACVEGRCEEMTEPVQLLDKRSLLPFVYLEEKGELRGHVMYFDRHHNVVTNIPVDVFRKIAEKKTFSLTVSGFNIRKFHERYEQDIEPYLVPNALGVLEIVSYGAKMLIVPRWSRDQEIVIYFS